MSFKDRVDAGKRLGRALARYNPRNPVVLALPRGGVPVAAEVALSLNAPLDLILVRKVGVPSQPELAMGAVADGNVPVIIRNAEVLHGLEMEQGKFDAACRRELAEVERRKGIYLGNRHTINLADKTAIVVDDGIATSSTMRAAVCAVRNRSPERIVVAVPVAPGDVLRSLRAEVDDIVCLEQHEPFGAIGLYYEDFTQLTDEDVIACLDRFRTHAAH